MTKKDKLIIKLISGDLKIIKKTLKDSEKDLKNCKNNELKSGLNYTIGYCTAHVWLIEKFIFYLNKKSSKDIQKIIDKNKEINKHNKKELNKLFKNIK